MKNNPEFFKHYTLQIKEKKIVEENLTRIEALEQGCLLIRDMGGDRLDDKRGTLGGIVYQTNDQEKKYALTCHHVFPENNLPVYVEDSKNITKIGQRVFTTGEYTDFAAIEIEKSFSNSCDLTFRRSDQRKANAFVYRDCIEPNSICYKNGAESKITSGRIEYSEFFINSFISLEKREICFLVQNKGKKFATNGDSGSLVFLQSDEEDHVNVIGMVCEHTTLKDPKKEKEGKTNDAEIAFCRCYRIHSSIDSFQMEKGITVKFKDDLPSSSSSTFSSFSSCSSS